MSETPQETETNPISLVGLARRHPVVTTLLVTSTLVGAILGGLYLTPEWSLVRRVAAGALAGGGVGFFVIATKVIG